ncbi:MAG: Cu(I)-responsive transcriptional regulator [Acetobacteraceae bacterium]
MASQALQAGIRARPGGTIGQAALASGVSAKMIRYYETIGLIRPASRSAGNYRTYEAADIQTLRFIARARSLGFSVDKITRLLALWREPGRNSADVKAVALRHVADLDERIRALQRMRAAIENLAAHCHGDDRPDCPILDDLAAERTERCEHHG